MFKDKQELSKEIKAKVCSRISYPNLDLYHESFDTLGSTISTAIYNCVQEAVHLTIEEIITTEMYTEEDFERDIGVR